MALTLVATAGSSAANAYADVAAADAVAAYRVGTQATAWAALTSDQKVQALATAAADIDSIEGTSPGFIGGFIGDRATSTQALEWPRSGTSYPGLPASLVRANIELALTYAPKFKAADVVNQDPNFLNVKRKKVDVLETEYFKPGFIAPTATVATAIERFPAIVQRLLAPLVVVASSFWRAGSGVVTRGS